MKRLPNKTIYLGLCILSCVLVFADARSVRAGSAVIRLRDFKFGVAEFIEGNEYSIPQGNILQEVEIVQGQKVTKLDQPIQLPRLVNSRLYMLASIESDIDTDIVFVVYRAGSKGISSYWHGGFIHGCENFLSRVGEAFHELWAKFIHQDSAFVEGKVECSPAYRFPLDKGIFTTGTWRVAFCPRVDDHANAVQIIEFEVVD